MVSTDTRSHALSAKEYHGLTRVRDAWQSLGQNVRRASRAFVKRSRTLSLSLPLWLVFVGGGACSEAEEWITSASMLSQNGYGFVKYDEHV